MATCREFIEIYKDARVNCATCRYRNGKKCNDEERVVAAQEREFKAFDRMMRDNKGVVLE